MELAIYTLTNFIYKCIVELNYLGPKLYAIPGVDIEITDVCK